MRPTDDVPQPDQCVFRAELIALLEERPPGRAQETAWRLIDRLERLEHEARRRGASGATLAAIEGAQALLALSELPPASRPSDPQLAKQHHEMGGQPVRISRSAAAVI